MYMGQTHLLLPLWLPILKTLLEKSEVDVLSSKAKVKVKKAIFCIYDIIFRRDVRIEINIPGKIAVYSVDEALKKDNISDLEWACAFVSSTVRSLHSHYVPGTRILPILQSKDVFCDFLDSAKVVIGKGFQISSVNDIIKTSPSCLAGEIINYLIKYSLYNECSNFLQVLIQENPIYEGFMIKATLELGSIKQALLDATIKIKEDPENAILLYYQAKGLSQLKMNTQALTMAKYAVELSPESTLAWVLLAHCHFSCNNISDALICLDMAPVYTDDLICDLSTTPVDKLLNTLKHTSPTKKNSSDFFSRTMAIHRKIDYDPTVDCLKKEEKFLMEKEDERVIRVLSNLRANHLSESEKAVYEELALIQTKIGWEALIAKRNEVKVKGYENGQFSLLYQFVQSSSSEIVILPTG